MNNLERGNKVTRISSGLRLRAIFMLLQDVPRDTIARDLKMSGQTVSEIAKLNPEEVIRLREVSKRLVDIDLLPIDALNGAKLLQELEKVGVATNEIQYFIQAGKKWSSEAGVPPDQAISAVTQLAKLETQSGKTYPQAMREYRKLVRKNKELSKQKKKLEGQNQQLQMEIAEKRKQLKQILKKSQNHREKD